MRDTDELRYIQAFARIIGVKEDAAIEYAERKGLNALVDNATQLLSTPVQREKHQAFLDLYRMSSTINTRNPIINSPEKASSYFHSVMDEIYDKEAFVVAFLNTKNRVIDHEVVSVGTINSSIVHPREVFRNAIINKANSVILCHNHPSGDLTPSTEDINITRRLKETGNLLGIKVLDHLIISGINQNEVYSFQAKGVLEAVEIYDIKSPQSVGEIKSDYMMPMQEHSYPMPDPNISISDRNSYGYLDDEMLPLSKERATELFKENLPVFLLYEDDSEAIAFDLKDIDNHNGIYGIERISWIDQQNYLETAEKSVEQNYNQIDGIINNKPTMEELEQAVKAGGNISLLDLANAVKTEREEKKTSVVKQLKVKPPTEKEKQKRLPQIGTEMER
ncbi:DNA repair protein RadC [Clostridium sporogenes]|uniref:RadC family protein n=1 Tax=Clostridium sporogenes TaxID=1509 RepID=UPI00313E3BE4